MKLNVGILVFVPCISLLAMSGYAMDCSGLPTSFHGNEFPTGNFFSNFNNSCYLINLSSNSGAVASEGDLNATYYNLYFKVDPRYQLVITGNYPNARYMNIAAYDEHFAPIPHISDTDIVPLASRFINPFQPGNTYIAGQKYAVPFNLGGTPGNIETGCSTSAFNFDVNALDATQRHQSMNWNSDQGYFQLHPQATLHVVDTPQHTNPNTGVMLHIRTYLNQSAQDPASIPHAILRDVASGCAYPAAYATQTLKVVTTNGQVAKSEWLDQSQEQKHINYDNYLPQLCFAVDPQNQVAWERGAEYVQGTGLTDSYVSGVLPNGISRTLAATGQVLRIRLRIPTTPPTPCVGCSRSGNEQTRYMSLSFVNYTAQSCSCNTTIASIPDGAYTKNASGYATLIVGTGANIPSWITPANGYTFLDLTKLADYQSFNNLVLRNILANPTFNCSGFVIPYLTEPATPGANLSSDYMPVVDYPVAATLPAVAQPLVRSPSCGVFPGRPGSISNCAVLAPTTLNITGVTTQCAAPGCTGVVVQPQPPLTIVGHGMGLFPNGLPFTGNTPYVKITDTTQGWEAGHGTDQCTVTIYQWTSNIISLVANVNQNGMCPMAAGDQLSVTIGNPQTMATANYSVTVSPN